jgi:DNA-directed RNA polymerase subunit A'
MTLRTFHFAGIKERNVTLGLPRLIELVDARKKPVTPTMDIYLDKENKTNREKAIEVARNVLQTKVMLRLWVKIKSGWTDDEAMMSTLGYDLG